jgi:NADH-quinone oxidoreductase subunit A
MLPFLVYSALIVAMAAIIIGLSTLLGRPNRNYHKDMPYESGIVPTGGGHVRMGVPYYLVAIFFIMFDVEILYLYPWAVAMYELSWAGFLKAFVFMVFVFAGLVYIWLRGGLIWRQVSRTVSETVSSSRS